VPEEDRDFVLAKKIVNSPCAKKIVNSPCRRELDMNLGHLTQQVGDNIRYRVDEPDNWLGEGEVLTSVSGAIVGSLTAVVTSPMIDGGNRSFHLFYHLADAQ